MQSSQSWPLSGTLNNRCSFSDHTSGFPVYKVGVETGEPQHNSAFFFHLVPHSFANQKGIRQWRSNQKQCTHTSQYLAILRNSKEAKVSTNQPGVESLSLASEFGQNMNSYRSEIKKSSIVVKSYEQKPSLTWKKHVLTTDLFYMK